VLSSCRIFIQNFMKLHLLFEENSKGMDGHVHAAYDTHYGNVYSNLWKVI
jgi:hypothetical protein